MNIHPMAGVAVFLSGMGLGLYFTGESVTPMSTPTAIWTVVYTALCTWVIWWKVGGGLWFRHNPHMRGYYRNLAAVAYAPLSLLSLRTVFWLTVVKDGTTEWTYNFADAQRLLLYGVLFATCILYITTIHMARRKFIAEKAVNNLIKSVLFFFVVPVLLCAFAFNPNIHRRLDLFHEGETLAPAMEIQTGKIPYKETVFLHGVLFDPGQGILSMHVFGPSLVHFRMYCAIIHSLLYVVLYFLGYAITGSWAWALGFPLIGGFLAYFPPHYHFINHRELFACVSLIFLLLYISNNRTSMLVISGVSAGYSFLWLCSSGITAIVAGTIFLGLYSLFCTDQQASRKSKNFISYISAVAFPLFVSVVWSIRWGCLKDMIEYNATLIKIHIIRQGFDFPRLLSYVNTAPSNLGLLRTISHAMKFFSDAATGFAYLFMLAMILTAFYISVSIVRGRCMKMQWKLFALLIFSMASFVKTIVMGRSFVLEVSGGFPGLLCFAWCWYFVGQLREAKRTSEMLVPLFGLVCLSGVVTSYYVPGLGQCAYSDVVPPFVPYHLKNRVMVPDHYTRTRIPRLDSLFIPNSQAMMVEELYDYVSNRTNPSETIFDFTSSPLYYFLLERNASCPYTTTEYIATAAQQRQTNQGIENHKTPLIIFHSTGSFSEYRKCTWGADFFTRQYLVSEYLMKHYTPAAKIGNVLLLSRGTMGKIDDSWREDMFTVRDLYWLPYAWGKFRKEQIGNAASRIIFWDAYALRRCSTVLFTQQKTETGRVEALYHFTMRTPQLYLDPWFVTYLKIRTRAVEPAHCSIRWKAQGKDSAEGGIRFYLEPDDNPHDYLVRLASYPEWMWVGSPIEWIEMDIESRADVELIDMELLEWSEEIGTEGIADRAVSMALKSFNRAAGT